MPQMADFNSRGRARSWSTGESGPRTQSPGLAATAVVAAAVEVVDVVGAAVDAALAVGVGTALGAALAVSAELAAVAAVANALPSSRLATFWGRSFADFGDVLRGRPPFTVGRTLFSRS